MSAEAAAEVFEARGEVDRLELQVELRSADTALFMAFTGAFGLLGLVMLYAVFMAPSTLPVVLFAGVCAIGLAGVVFPRLRDEEHLELTMNGRSLALHRTPMGWRHEVPLESLDEVVLVAGQLVFRHGDAELAFPVPRRVAPHIPWLIEEVDSAAARRTRSLEGAAPTELERLRR